jgi:hypothetical protein
MTLDVNTQRGQQTLMDERAAVAIFHSNYPKTRYCDTPKHDVGDIDGVIINTDDWRVRGVAETKCRYDVTLAEFHVNYGDEWLVTFDKIIKGMKIAEAMRVPFFGFLYVVQSKALLIKKLWSPEKGLEFEFVTVRKTRTQASVNGGSALRDNAFLNMSSVEPLYLREG